MSETLLLNREAGTNPWLRYHRCQLKVLETASAANLELISWYVWSCWNKLRSWTEASVANEQRNHHFPHTWITKVTNCDNFSSSLL